MKDYKGFKIPVILSGSNRRADRSVSLKFVTQKELDVDEFSALDMYHLATGWLLFSETEVSTKDIPDVDPEIEGKTPAQRLRSVIFLLWKQKGKKGDFETTYRSVMEKFITNIKDKLV